MKITSVAHPIQGLIKYHGLRRRLQRIPYHDSISVCIEALTTTTTVGTFEKFKKNEIVINGKEPRGKDRQRVETVLNKLKKLGEFRGGFKVVSENSLKEGKGLGFSASGFAALGLAASKALELRLDEASLSEIVRLGAGSATRSLAGGFAVWYSDKNGKSYAEQLSAPDDIDLSMVVVPICSDVKTDEAHAEVRSSPLFRARLDNIRGLLEKMKLAIGRGDVATLGRLAEEDTLNLHAITMTGKSHMVLWEPDTVRVIKEVNQLREEGIPAWYSTDTGPSVFVNTFSRTSQVILSRFHEIGFEKAFTSKVGGKPFLCRRHLF